MRKKQTFMHPKRVIQKGDTHADNIFFNNSNHIILAEIYYQKNDCYNSLVMVNSALAFMEAEGNENIWIVGRFFQMCIMIVTGQVYEIGNINKK